MHIIILKAPMKISEIFTTVIKIMRGEPTVLTYVAEENRRKLN